MPELPDILLYQYALRARVVGHQVTCVRLAAPFLLRSVEPPIAAAERRTVVDIERLGKRVVFAFEGDLFVVVHLMIAGRFKWRPPKAPVPRRLGLLAMDFDHGTLLLTEAGSTRRASLHVVDGRHRLAALDPGGLEVLEADAGAFSVALRRENHTLKRALTDPHIFSGIGNAYSDEILHAAKLSPVRLTSKLTDSEIVRLHTAAREVLTAWTDRLRRDSAGRFPGPGEVTAFRPDFAVHGKFGKPCPVCGTTVQRIRYAENDTNYCPRCQTGGTLLADRSLSRLLKGDWPRSIDEIA
jgi:formamidopyrimidine-DNA glycosylase